MMLPGTAQEQHRETHTVSVAVLVNGRDLTKDPGGLVALSVYEELNRIPTARLIFSDGAVESQRFDKSNDPLFAPGQKVTIQFGYDQKEETVFEGIITRHGVRVLPHRPYSLEIECKDVSVRTSVVKKSRYHYGETDSSLIRGIAEGYPDFTSVTVDSTVLQHEELVQYDVSDWDFMLLRADANGLYVLPRNGSLVVKKPEIKATPDLQVQFGTGSTGIPVLEFESDMDARHHFSSVKGTSWDQSRQEILEETESGSPSANGHSFPDVLYRDNPFLLVHGGDLASEELQDWVRSVYQRSALSRVRGRIGVTGILVAPGATVGISGIGDRFNGNHLVSGVVHQYAQGHWKTDIQFGWTPEPVHERLSGTGKGGAGLVAGIPGLQIGVVSALAGDPQPGEHRVQVRLPVTAKNPDGSVPEGIWARLALITAGKDHGFVFRPEVGDEVIVGFINGDPNDAVVLGSLHSGRSPAPSGLSASDENPVKGFVSVNGLELLFDDSGEKITITAGSGGPSLELDGKEKKISISLDSSNSIEITSGGVKVAGTRIELN